MRHNTDSSQGTLFVCMYLLHGLCAEGCLLEWCCVRRRWQSSHGTGSQSPASHRRESCSVLRQSMLDLWWTEWHWDRFLCKYFRCSLLEPFYHCPILIVYRVRCSSRQWTASLSNPLEKESYRLARVQRTILEPEWLEECTRWKTLRFMRTCHRKLLRWSNRVWWIVWACSTRVGDLRFGFVFTPNSILTFSHCERIYYLFFCHSALHFDDPT